MSPADFSSGGKIRAIRVIWVDKHRNRFTRLTSGFGWIQPFLFGFFFSLFGLCFLAMLAALLFIFIMNHPWVGLGVVSAGFRVRNRLHGISLPLVVERFQTAFRSGTLSTGSTDR